MNMQISKSVLNKLRPQLSQKYLDWAEMLPKFGGGTIAHLQRIRESDRQDSIRAFERTRAPENTRLTFHYIRMCEMFQIEQFDEVHTSLLQLFPMLNDPVLQGRELPTLKNLAESAFEGGWSIIGVIEREPKILATTVRCISPELPDQISYIEIRLHKVLPSIFALTFDVHLSLQATTQLLRLQAKQYLPEVLFQSIAPWKLTKKGYSTMHAEYVMTREIFLYIERLRAKVESFLAPYFFGFFMSRSNRGGSKLPAIEVFSIRGIPPGDNAWGHWEEMARGWYSSFGFEFYLGAFGDGKQIATLPESYRWYGMDPFLPEYRLVVLEDAFLQSVDREHFKGNEEVIIPYYTESSLIELVPLVIILEFVKSSENSVRELRKTTFKRMHARPWLQAHIKLNNEIHSQTMLINAVSKEFTDSKGWLSDQESELLKLKSMWPRRDEEQLLFIKHLVNVIDFRISRLERQLSYLTSSYSNYLILQNMAAIHKLQAAAAIAAIASVVFTIIITIISSKNIFAWLSSLLE